MGADVGGGVSGVVMLDVGDGVKDRIGGVEDVCMGSEKSCVCFIVSDVEAIDTRGACALLAEGDLCVSILCNLPKPVFVQKFSPGFVRSLFL